MNGNSIMVVTAALGFMVNVIAILGIAWKGGHVLGGIQEAVKRWSEETHLLRLALDVYAPTLARTVAQLDDLERRVQRLENAP